VPVVKAMAPEFKAIADDVQRWVSNGGLDRFLKTVTTTGVPAFHNLRLAADQVLSVLGTGYRSFLPEAQHLADVIKKGGDNLRGWADNGGFSRFLLTVKQNAPQVRQFFSDLFAALGHISDSLGPLGGLSLKFVDGILKLINALPPSVIQAVYLGFIAWRTGMLLYAAATTIATIATAAFDTVASPFFLLLAGAALTVLAVVAALVALGVGIYELVKHWGTVQAALVTAWNATWNAIKVAALAVWNTVLKPAFNGIMVGIHAVGTAATWLWVNAIKPAFDAISVGARLLVVIIGTILITPVYLLVKGLGALFGWLWKVAIQPAFNGIATAAKWLYNVGIKPQIDAIVTAVHAVGTAASWLWHSAIQPAVSGITSAAKWLYTNGIKPAFNSVVGAVKDVGKWAKWLWSNAISPAVNSISGGARSLYRNGIKPPFDSVVSAMKTVGKWASWLWTNGIKPAWKSVTDGTGKLKDGMVKLFDGMKTGIGKVWDKIKGVVATPINFVIGTVYNGGIVKVWNKIADAVGLKSKELGTVGKIKFRHGGPVTGGAPGVDSVNALMMPGEHVWTADEVRNAGGHGAMAQMRAMFASQGRARMGPTRTSPTSSGGAYRFKDGGGILGGLSDAWDATGGKVVSGVADAGKWGLGKLNDLARGAIGTVVNPILNAIISAATSGINGAIPGSPPWQSLVSGAATAPIKWIKDFVSKDDKKNAFSGGVGGKIPAGQHKAVIDAALAAAGVPPPGTKGQWEAGMNTLITRESGWNAGAINRWDSNAKAGHPSQGLTQTIPGTFAAYVPKSLRGRGILDPVANVAASIRYIVSRYGNISNVQQANASKPPKGYAMGGVMGAGLHLVGEKGPELVASSGNDRVYTYAETMKMMKAAGASGGGPTIVNFPDKITIKTENGSFEATVDDIARGTINDVVNQAAGSR
jgi:SLT domain-containing protein